jgi:ribosome-binding factor A
MPKDFERTRRIGEQLQRELAQLVQFELRDPRLHMPTISAVKVSKDLGNARVYITVFNEEQDRQSALEALQHAAGFLQRELGKRLHLRSIPRLHFVYDDSIKQGAHLSELIDTAVAEDLKHHSEDDNGA